MADLLMQSGTSEEAQPIKSKDIGGGHADFSANGDTGSDLAEQEVRSSL